MKKVVDRILAQLAELIAQDRYIELESDTVEFKPVPSDSASWREIHKSVNAFLNTRGGILFLGITEKGQGNSRRYALSGYHHDAEPRLKELTKLFADHAGNKLDLGECFPPMEVHEVLDKRVAVIYVDELAADRKYCYLRDEAYRRQLTGDHRISEDEISRQEEFKEEAYHARELQLVPDASIE